MTRGTIIDKALQKAEILHKGQVRKSDGVTPYITHLKEVAGILKKYTSDEHVIAAGILHDAIEDTPYTPEALEHDFGLVIRDIVMGVTEKKMRDGKKIPWKVRKEAYLHNLQHVSRNSLLVCAADKVHNMNSCVHDFQKQGSSVWSSFNAEPKEQVWYYGAVLHILTGRLRHSRAKGILAEYRVAFDRFCGIAESFYAQYE
ncbi:MAG: bifunctional (p)ppGpp synthetase/guanosine-3',5'-bis(diphosphate) 3'-pyrophosphohydrolase [Candidatus Niyogibacteria bacterium CG10_big_fil_rev_8_21_14_0_10_46_36]|uniref:Bifunctional (P)ppGpp synthetase/guanosine-3',5'-bis(Diphosphate) 3'-pyrophosphohydrolase n=1 Tax=Candidatus Niyogibacteria bacterium CG10_big_fil_rev_8_21_14_0_10_46_36 TaxID=1974726 RepID=A0A2H0TE56_9BACT|nr:MAG: bifunctional (p)ppGpp synthetase/guanosine-3',5'-bis(diphosphate) 3'-pyrophosphohydrolase [Candidatus Niyogibacteria bacterium CG10_big_fil_rev_8_21_14_0_10_46_36]